MKYFKAIPLFAIILVSIACDQKEKLTKLSDEKLIERIVGRNLPTPDQVIIKNAEGNVISIDSMTRLEETGQYFEDFYVNEKGQFKVIVIRKKTSADDILIARINEALNPKKEVNMVDINCDDKKRILQNILVSDQKMRQGNADIDPETDHKNLEIVISLLNKCGIPTLNEVNRDEMSAIWLVIQHSDVKWMKSYLPLLEASAKNGDLEWHQIAMTRDRILINDGKPQVYGSQIIDNKLANLYEPEYVNQRRAAMGMGPIEEYLQHFDIEFNIPQKTK
ncbi:MAG: hypothetical protein IPM42_15705 [Saprospiraceae bacterium]|nr:hypothetical protein [Saprospiraceae bacterium]